VTKSSSKRAPTQARRRREGEDDLAAALTAGITDLVNTPTAPLAFHPLADLFPLMEGAEFDELVADIKANALRMKIVLHEGKILDGRNRYRAMLAAGHTPNEGHFEKYKPATPNDTPLNYVIRANLLRRHLTAEQRRDMLVKLVAQQPAKSDRAIAREAGITDHKQVSRARKRGEATGAIAPVGRRRGADGKTRQRPKGKAGKSKDATAKKALGAGGDSADLETSAAGGGQEQRAELDETSAPARAPLTREEILHADGYWAVLLATNDIDGARKLHALLLDDERRTVFTETLGIAISAVEGKDREVLVDVLADAIGVTDKTASDANGNDINPKLSADRMRETFAAMEKEESKDTSEDETIDDWKIKFKKYPGGWFWSASANDKVLSSNPKALFATREEAQADARAATEATPKEMIALIRKINIALKPKHEAIRNNPLYGQSQGAGRFERVRLSDGSLMQISTQMDVDVDPVKVAAELGIK
jgi:hypothetical protein